jgi:putative tryptophan/tyrosine transport system substrate-binding protein
MRRREFIVGLGALTWPLTARAQQATLPVVAFVNGGTPEGAARYVAAFHAGLGEHSFVDNRNVTIEYHWLEGQTERLPNLIAGLVRRRVTVIVTAGQTTGALAAKAATTTIPIVFGVGDDPVRLGLVTSLASPGGNLTGMNFFMQEAVSKVLGLLHELVPKAARLAVLVNPQNTATTEATLREVQIAAPLLGLQVDVLKASTSRDIEDTFGTLARERTEALFVGGDSYFVSRRAQFATLAARHSIPTAYISRDFVQAGGLMSYGTDLSDMYRQIGAYVGQILKGAKPADLPVVQPTKFEFAINMQTAKTLRIEVPPGLLAAADEVIE